MGDINVDFKNNQLTNEKWKQTVETYDLPQLINIPARITDHSETIIDLYKGCSGSSWNLAIKVSNIDIILSCFDISQVDIN